MSKSNGKHFAPIYLFLLLFALLIIFLYWITHREKSKEKYKVSKIILKGDNKGINQKTVWNGEKDLAGIRAQNKKMVQFISDGSVINYTLIPEMQGWFLNELKKYDIPYGAGVLISIPDGKIKMLQGYSVMEPKLTAGELTLKAWAPGASLIKLVTATALLNSEGFDSEQEICFHGGRRGLKPEHFNDNPEKDKDCETIYQAFGNSTNAIFAKLGYRFLTKESFLSAALMYGFNRTTQFDFPVEKSQITISSAKYSLGYTCAGFGNVTLSPFQAAKMMAVIANGGKAIHPRVIESVVSQDGKNLYSPPPINDKFQPIPKGILDKLIKMMATTVTEGTARSAFYSKSDEPRLNFTVAGKTGTLSRNKPVYLQYTWFAGFAPIENPKVAFSVLIVNPLKWRTKAIYMGERLLLKYFNYLKSSKSLNKKSLSNNQ